jgi:hypothetical protein
MSDRAISEEAMLSSLRDIRLPTEAAGGAWADLAATIGLAAMAALGVVLALRVFSLRRAAPATAGPKAALDALRDLPDEDRRVALLHLLRDHAPDRHAALRDRLYRPAPAIALSDLEAEVARHV